MGARTIPIFPLPVVLFPGALMPLHIFEPRYRRMLADCLAGDRQFGLILCPEGVDESALPAGEVGCIARIESAEPLPDGRANIAVSGGDRFALVRLVPSPHAYHVAEIAAYADEPHAEPLSDAAERVQVVFHRIVHAARILTDDTTPPPELPDDPALLAFRIASLIDIDLATRQRLLASRSPAERLTEIERVLEAAVDPLERRAEVHRLARQNGRGLAHGSSG